MLRKVLYILALLFVIVVLGYLLADEPLPKGESGPRADFLAEKMLATLNYDSWKNIEAVAWSYPTGHDYIWDKQANLVEVKWSGYRVILETETRQGKAFLHGEAVIKEKNKILDMAYANFANDSFWLIAPFKVFDPGTVRKAVDYEGQEALLIQYTTGGVTPGDSYLWILDESGLPLAWKFWVDMIPVGGIKFTWENWRTIEGAQISTFHDGLIDIEITNLRTSDSASELNNGIDPFKAIR